METSDQTKTRAKSYTYRTSIAWTGGRSGILESNGKPSIKVSSPPEFKGEAGVWTPEDMFVASVEICHMATFLAFAARQSIAISSYKSHSNGVLEFIDGDFRFTRIVIFPTIVVGNSESEAQVHAILREAQKHCLVTNSIASIVEVNPTIVMG
jgi:peroxiredoxin-like protein